MTTTTTARSTITLQIPVEVLDSLDEVQDFLEDRLIGRIPVHLQSLVFAAKDADTRAIVLVDEAGQEPEPGTESDITPAEIAAMEAYDLEANTPEWLADEEAHAKRTDWERAQHARVEGEYNEWLTHYASAFDQARGAWWRNRNAELRSEYDRDRSDVVPTSDLDN
ncbi:hypothetical protein SAMN06295974_3762 [Plantibacter flavus]|uniref:Uncharacterized protein n=1 Tax=Plantibacter flavus TaxID=150123 RepID=A0A3N2BLE9_9MICO|nr:hypothetical protein [Plantibacter flavus]ROR76090.1 hypothetical protein EDD42_4043 [Plantibacter flavus]SMG48652.1 hypothetical protein SAMN06295974_3762 [Plantibacter flavus]